jgi:diacylglycerol O-acyltransferase / wax synthase
MAAMTDSVSRREEPVIDRASPTDRAFLAMDTGQVPEQFGVILLLDQAGGLNLSRARRLIAERIPAVPRLRQRLLRAPFGCGGPIWVDDPDFDIRGHVRAVASSEPGDERAGTALGFSEGGLERAQNRQIAELCIAAGGTRR